MSNTKKTQRKHAKRAIKIKKEIDALTAERERILAEIMDITGGESVTVDVPGKGKVMFVRGTEGGEPQGTFAPVFDAAKFHKLSEARKRALAQSGVVVMKEKVSSTRKPSVKVTLNA